MTDPSALTREQLENLVRAADVACDDLNVQCRFWRQCAEHAIDGWNALEDKVDTVVQKLAPYEGLYKIVDETLSLLTEECPVEPPAPLVDQTIDLGNGVKLRVVETETPLPEKK